MMSTGLTIGSSSIRLCASCWWLNLRHNILCVGLRCFALLKDIQEAAAIMVEVGLAAEATEATNNIWLQKLDRGSMVPGVTRLVLFYALGAPSA